MTTDTDNGTTDDEQNDKSAPSAFLEWLNHLRKDRNAYVVENDTTGPTKATVWVPEEIDVPQYVRVASLTVADGKAPAVQEKDVEGWEKYDLEVDPEHDPVHTAHVSIPPAADRPPFSLSRGFLVEAEGPATLQEAPGEGFTVSQEADVELTHHVGDLLEFADWYHFRNQSEAKKHALEWLLDRQDTEGVIKVEFDQLPEWTVRIDGRVEAFISVANVLAGDAVTEHLPTPEEVDADEISPMAEELADTLLNTLMDLAERSAPNPDPDGPYQGPDDILERIAKDLHDGTAGLWGPGATLAHLDAKNGGREDLTDYVDRWSDDLQEGQ